MTGSDSARSASANRRGWGDIQLELETVFRVHTDMVLVLAVGQGDAVLSALAALLATSLPTSLKLRQFGYSSENLNPLIDFQRGIDRGQYVTLASGLGGLEEGERRKALELLNWNRGLMERGGIKLVLWVEPSLVPSLYRYAGDFADWWTALIELPDGPPVALPIGGEPEAPRALSPPQGRDDPRRAALEQALAERRRRIRAGEPTGDLDTRILDLKRAVRRGPTPRSGDVLNDRYELVEVLGQGGFATVWRAWDARDAQMVAVKILHAQWMHDRTRRERFLRGARQQGELAHPAVVPVYGTGIDDDGTTYLVMKYCPGGDLREAIAQGRLDREAALRLLPGVADALAVAHDRGVVHRDVKPSNILLGDAGQALLTDFDLAKARDTTGGTRTGAMGSMVYAAPEAMVDASRADWRADQYGLGMTAVYVALGRDLPMDVVYDRSSFMAGLPVSPALRAVLERATAIKPEDRFPDLRALEEALREALQA